MGGAVGLQQEAGSGGGGDAYLHAPVAVYVGDSSGAVDTLGDIGQQARGHHGYPGRPALEVCVGGHLVLGYLRSLLQAVGGAVMMHGVGAGIAGVELIAHHGPDDIQQAHQAEGVAGDVHGLYIGLVGAAYHLQVSVAVDITHGWIGDYLAAPGHAAGVMKVRGMGQGIEAGDLLRVHQLHRPPSDRGTVGMPCIYMLVQAGGDYLQ